MTSIVLCISVGGGKGHKWLFLMYVNLKKDPNRHRTSMQHNKAPFSFQTPLFKKSFISTLEGKKNGTRSDSNSDRDNNGRTKTTTKE